MLRERILKKMKRRELNIPALVFVGMLVAMWGLTITVSAIDTPEYEPIPEVVAEPLVEQIAEASVEDTESNDTLEDLAGGITGLIEGTGVQNVLIGNTYEEGFEEPKYIRCTGYCDYGYTKSGQYVRDGIMAGKKEWLGKTCVVYQVNEDGSCGNMIGMYEFLDTGNGINGSLINGTSVDIWFPTESEVWNWMSTYGDYVYIQIIDAVG